MHRNLNGIFSKIFSIKEKKIATQSFLLLLLLRSVVTAVVLLLPLSGSTFRLTMLRSFVLLLLVSLVAVEGIKRTLITANLFCHGLPHTGKAIVELWEFDSNSPDDYFDTTSMDGGSNSLAVVGYSDEWAVNDGNEYYLNIRHSCTNIGGKLFSLLVLLYFYSVIKL